jgi:hypothetical protein
LRTSSSKRQEQDFRISHLRPQLSAVPSLGQRNVEIRCSQPILLESAFHGSLILPYDLYVFGI